MGAANRAAAVKDGGCVCARDGCAVASRRFGGLERASRTQSRAARSEKPDNELSESLSNGGKKRGAGPEMFIDRLRSGRGRDARYPASFQSAGLAIWIMGKVDFRSGQVARCKQIDVV